MRSFRNHPVSFSVRQAESPSDLSILMLGCAFLLLLCPSESRSATFAWDGGGNNANWNTAANWDQGNDLPNADDNLVFDGATPLASVNNLPSAWFRSISFTVAGHGIQGEVSLTNGVSLTHGTGVTRFHDDLYLRRGQTLLVAHSRAILRAETTLTLAANSTPEDIVVGNPQPLKIITLNTTGRVEVANLIGRGGRIHKYGTGSLIIERTSSEWIFLDLHQGNVSMHGPAVDPGTGPFGVGVSCKLYQSGHLSGWGELWSVDSVDGGMVTPGGFDLPLLVKDSAWLARSNMVMRIYLSGQHLDYNYSQLAVEKLVKLSGASGACRLAIDVSAFLPIIGHGFRIIDNRWTAPISGAFHGLPQGAVTNVNGTHLEIDYEGGDGNDVVLTVVAIDSTGDRRVWTGLGTDNLWTTPENWEDDRLPQAGDDLEFPWAGLRHTNDNSFPSDMSFGSVTLTGRDYQLNGASIRLTGGVHARNASGANTFNIPVRLDAHQIFTNASHGLGVTLNFTSVIIPNHYELLFQNDLGDTFVGSAIAGKGQVGKGGPGELIFDHPNSYTLFTRVFAGKLTLNPNGGLGVGGTIASSTIVYPGATLSIVGAHSLNEFIACWGTNGSGSIQAVGGPSTLSGSIDLLEDARVTVLGAGGHLILSGPITGPGGLRKSGSGRLSFYGSQNNTFTGPTWVEDGTLDLAKTTGAQALAGPLFVGDDSGAPDSAQVHILLNNQIENGAELDIRGDGRLWIAADKVDVVGSLAGTGAIDSGSSALLGVGDNNTSTEYSGSISGDGNLWKVGTGVLTLSGNSSHPVTYIANGTVLLSGSHGGDVTVAPGGTLRGGGAIAGNLDLAGGAVHPGPGGVLNVLGNFQATAASQVLFTLAGTIAGVGYDQLDVAGTVTLGNAGLVVDVDPGFTPPEGASFTLINNAGLGSVLGTFAGLSNGDLLAASGSMFQIYYAAGTGNDVVITEVPGMQMAMVNLTPKGRAEFTGSYLPRHNVFLEATADLGGRARWTTIDQAVVNELGFYQLADSEAGLYPCRFYRVRFE